MSYNIRTQKWGDPTRGTESGEIEWSMDLTGGGLKVASGYSLSDYEGAMQAAFDRWEEVADIDFTYVGSTGGEVSVDMAYLAGSTVGQATWNGGSVISFGRIDMDNEPTWSPFGGGGTSFYAVALHEIGHILGFNHVSDTSEIMNGYISRNDLGDGDITGAQILYGVGDATPEVDDGPDDTGGGGGGGLTSGSDDGGGGGGVGAIIGLLAVIIGAIFGLGGGGLVIAAATEGEGEGDEDGTEPVPVDGDEVLLTDLIPDTGMLYTHNVYLTEADLIAAEGEDWADHDHHAHDHGDCDHTGPCDCHTHAKEETGEVLLTDLIPVTAMLSEYSTCEADDLAEDEMEDDLLFV